MMISVLTHGTASQALVHPLLEVRDLVMRYDDKSVLDGLRLDVQRGETIVIIGGSGSGCARFFVSYVQIQCINFSKVASS